VGIILGIVVSLKINSLKFSSIHLAAVGLLWLYAMQLKKKPIVGNIAVAILSALVMLLPIVYEPIVFYNSENNFHEQIQIILQAGLVFAAFALLTQWIREMIKDLQDVEGDELTGCNTLPIWLSIKSTKIILSILIATTLFSGAWFQFHFYVHRKFYPVFNLWNLFTIVLIQLPLLVVIVKLWKAEKPEQYKVLSTIMKVVMFAGIFSMLFIQQWFQQYFN
jgi:4-hydroxybenzoate polyprenyltransferase